MLRDLYVGFYCYSIVMRWDVVNGNSCEPVNITVRLKK